PSTDRATAQAVPAPSHALDRGVPPERLLHGAVPRRTATRVQPGRDLHQPERLAGLPEHLVDLVADGAVVAAPTEGPAGAAAVRDACTPAASSRSRRMWQVYCAAWCQSRRYCRLVW